MQDNNSTDQKPPEAPIDSGPTSNEPQAQTPVATPPIVEPEPAANPTDSVISSPPQTETPQVAQPIPPVDQPPQPPNPQAGGPKPVSGILSMIFGLLIVAIIGGVGFYLFQSGIIKNPFTKPTTPPNEELTTEQATPIPTVDPTADWETYTNTKYGYSFKHPSNYQVGQNGMGSKTLETEAFIIAYDSKSSEPTTQSRFTVSIIGSNKDIDSLAQKNYLKVSEYKIKDIVAAQKDLPNIKLENNSIVKPLTDGKFNNLNAIMYTIKGSTYDDGGSEGVQNSLNTKYIWFEHNNNAFQITLTDDELMNNILSTFKFTETTISESPTASPSAQ